MKIGILGAAGRMGQMIARELLSRHHAAEIGAVVEHGESWALGRDIGEITGSGPTGLVITARAEDAFRTCDVLIDFTTPASLIDHLTLAQNQTKPLIVGTTGLSTIEEAALRKASGKTAIFHAANMSIGVNLLLSLVEQAAARLKEEFDIEIFEAHHRHKIDAPSGTALALGEAAAKGRAVALKSVMRTERHGKRNAGDIGFSVFRGGDVVGEHTVTFAGAGERLELAHKATDRAIFARGAIKAALWLKDRPAGFYSMQDVLK